MRVPKILTSKTRWKGPRRALLEIHEDEEVGGEQRLNNLCTACRGLKFDFKAARETGLEETLPVKLYDGVGDMFESALGGCHLCTIFLEALGAALYKLRVEVDHDSRSVEEDTCTADEELEDLEGSGVQGGARNSEHDEGSEHDEDSEQDEDSEHAENSKDNNDDLNDYANKDDDNGSFTREIQSTTSYPLAPPRIQIFGYSNSSQKLEFVIGQNMVLSNAELLALLTRWSPGPVLISCKRDRESLRVFHDNNDTGALSTTVSLSYAVHPSGRNQTFHDVRGMQLALSVCQGTHGVCHKSKSFTLPKRLIDISQGLGNLRLVETSFPDGSADETLKERLQYGYATVSHRWSPDLSCKLTSQTQDEYQQRIPQSDLPPHFRDAILLARAMYLEFIWIDSLCTVQAGDGGRDWRIQAPEMANVYRGAELNISLDIMDAWHGFLHMSPRQVQSCAILSLKSKRAVGPLPTIQQAVDLGDLEDRAWTMQERLLARRVLHCTGWGMVWECAEENTGLEDNKHERDLFSKGRHHGLVLHAEPRAYKPIAWSDYRIFHLQYVTETYFNVWHKLVEKYSYRKLTVPSDRLIAVAGLARQFSACSTIPISYLAGIWAEDLAHGLSWDATDSLSNLPDDLRTQASQMRKSPGRVSFDTLPYRAPSWSWASVDSSIDYGSLDNWYKNPAPKQDYAPSLLSYNFENSNDNPFGIPTSASITMRGLCADHLAFKEPAHKVLEGDSYRSSDKAPELLGRSGLVSLDRNGVELSDEGIGMWDLEPLDMMPKDTIVFLLWKSPTVEGLVLLPARENSSCYRRIGKWSLETHGSDWKRPFNLDIWKERELTIV